MNRPFRSVGELGYVYRDLPWKTLDFFSNKSADAALLDLFSVGETASLQAGVVNLNTRNAVVLKSVLSGASSRELVAPSILSNADATSIAENLAAYTQTSPLVSRGDLVKFISATTTLGDAKQSRETVARALAGSGQTRTWNLLVDLVAQSGHYGASAATLDKFVVEGERHYWMHLAIDRFTGHVVDQQLELVTE